MHRSLAILVVTIVCSGILAAQDDFRVFPYLQHPAPDAISILWFSGEQLPGTCAYREQGSHLKIMISSDPVPAEGIAYSGREDSIFFKGEAPSIPFRHRVRIENLEPGTSYEYSVTQGTTIFRSAFRTAPVRETPIRFIVYADSETEPESTGNYAVWVDPVNDSARSYLWDQTTGYRNNLEVIRSREPDLVFIAGDLVQSGGEQRDWDEFWDHNTDPSGALSLAGQVPLMAAPGNHEYFEGPYLDGYDQPGSERAIKKFLTYFEFPLNHAPDTAQEGRYYFLEYGPATFIVLDVCNNSPNGSDEDTNFRLLGENDPGGSHSPDFGVGSAQYVWLEERLAEAQARSLFTFVIFHHAPYSSGPHGFPPGEDTYYDYQSGMPVRVLTPLLIRYGVDAVISGHDEMWERSEVTGLEIHPDGSETMHTIQFYDVGIGGDGLRGPVEGTDNPFQQFLVHRDVPEIWEEGVLLDGGKHYGHLEVDILPVDSETWQAVLKPVYVFPVFVSGDSACSAYERRIYDDKVILTASEEGEVSVNDMQGNSLRPRSYPNPTGGQVFIVYHLPGPCNVSISLLDTEGREIGVLEPGWMNGGIHQAVWDGKDGGGKQVPPGIYFFRLESGPGEVQSGRITLLH